MVLSRLSQSLGLKIEGSRGAALMCASALFNVSSPFSAFLCDTVAPVCEDCVCRLKGFIMQCGDGVVQCLKLCCPKALQGRTVWFLESGCVFYYIESYRGRGERSGQAFRNTSLSPSAALKKKKKSLENTPVNLCCF